MIYHWIKCKIGFDENRCKEVYTSVLNVMGATRTCRVVCFVGRN